MGSKKYLFLLLLTPFILFSILFHPLQVSAISSGNFAVAKIDQTIQYPLIITKNINATTIQVNQSLIVQINIKNLNTVPIYGVHLTEPRFTSPIFNYKGLPNETIDLGTLNGNSNITFFYILMVFQPIGNVTLPASSVSYYTSSLVTNKTNLPVFTSYSPSIVFYVIPINSDTRINENNLLIISGLFLVYSIIVIISAVTLKLNKNN